jgi:polyribonucleotide nucleotidyltransferase
MLEEAMTDRMFQEIEVGMTYTGRVVSITAFGAFMEVLPGKDGLVHVSELAEGRVEKVEDVVKKGDLVTAKCLGVDEKGRVKMSRRAWLREEKAREAEANGAVEETTTPLV